MAKRYSLCFSVCASRRGSALSVIALLILSAGAPGCTQPTTPSQRQTVAAPASSPANTRQLGHFTATVDHAAHTMAIKPVGTQIALDENFKPMTLDPITIAQDDGGANQPANTVDLVSTNCIDGYPTSPTFQCDVELRSFFSRSLANVYAEIDSVSFDGSPISGYDATNSDSDLLTPAGNLSNGHGLWSYTNASENAAAISPVLTSNAEGFNTGMKTWNFANAANQTISYDILVFATEGFPSYTLTQNQGNGTYGNLAYMDACTSGTSFTSPDKTQISLPFDFTFYNTNTTTINVARNGQITFSALRSGTGLPTAISTSVRLPAVYSSTNVPLPRPVFFPFWDDLVYGTNGTPGQICYQTIGAAPNRQFVVEWRNMTFANAPDEGASLNFEVYLYEGTGEIDTVYHTMTNAPGDTSNRASGTQAWVGMQNEAGSVATGEFHVADYGSGSSYSYIPSPGCPSSDTRTNGHCAFTRATGQYEPFALATDATNIYWTNNDNGTVMQMPIGGGKALAIASGQTHPQGLTVAGESVYWATGTSILEAPIGGGSPVTLAVAQDAPWALATDGASIYWTNEGTYESGFHDGTIMKLALGVGATPVTLASAQYAPAAIAVDQANVYWADLGSGAIMQTSLGSATATPITLASGAAAGEPRSIVVDATSVYWTNYASAGTVMAVPIGGGAITTLASGQAYPYGVAVDSTSVYWTNYANGTVMTLPLSGGSPEALASGEGTPEGITVDANNAYWITHGSSTFNGSVAMTAK